VLWRFWQDNVGRAGITLGVEYTLMLEKPEFEIEYSISNASGDVLLRPFAMLGFPGFPKQDRTSAIGTALDTRLPLRPHGSFWDEAREDGREEYLLLRHDVYPQTAIDTLRAVVSIVEQNRVFTLESWFVPDDTYRHVFSAHTNKVDTSVAIYMLTSRTSTMAQ